MKTVALFGGSFDPPHIAHEMIVKEALKLKDVEKVIIMPTYLNPFKDTFFAPSALRLQWLKTIFSSYENVEVDDFEVKKKEKVPSITTVEYLLKKYSKIYLIIGADNLQSLHKWYRYDSLKEYVTFVVATRNNIKIPESFIELHVDEVLSSTQLRENMNSLKLSKKCSSQILEYYKENNE